MKKLLLALLLVFLASNVEAANRYWVGGGSSTAWNATGNTNWSASSGGANNASVPTSSDVAYFDTNSGSGTSSITANITVGGVIATGYTGTWSQSNSTTLTISSSLATYFTLSAGMTYTASSSSQALAFTGSNDVFVDMAGHTVGSVTINGAGQTVYVQDAWTLIASGTLTLTAGNLYDSGGYSMTMGAFSSANSNVRSADFTGATVTTLNGGSTTPWNTSTTTNFTFIAPATLNIDGGGVNHTFTPGALTFNAVKINPSQSGGYTFSPTGFTGSTVTIYGPIAIPQGTGSLTLTATTFVFDSSAGGFQFSNSGNGSFTVSQSSGTVTMAKASISRTTFSGGATFSATDSYDLGGNSGITITAPGGGGASGGYIIGGN